MSARTRRSTAIALTVALTAGAAALLTGCGPDVAKASGSPSTGATSAAPATPATTAPASPASPASPSAPSSTAPSATPTPTAYAPKPTPAPPLNGTAHTALTISNGTNFVLMNGTSVDFGTIVQDLAWSADGSRAVFIDGSGNLVTANPNGSGRVVVARNPGGQTWSHPTWQHRQAIPADGLPGKENLIFATAKGGVSQLESVPATAVNATPELLDLGGYSGDNIAPLPQTGNTWPNAGGKFGTAVYANSASGEVYLRDDNLREQGGTVAQGSQPALAPNGEDIVFVRSSGGHDHVFEQNRDGKVKDLTPNATTDYTEPAWSPDGATVALRTPTGVATVPADGSKAPTRVSDYPGLPAYRG